MFNLKINRITLLRWISIGLISLAILLLVFQLIQYSQIRSGFPPGTKIGGVAVGGLNQQQAADRISQALSIPVELKYGQDIIQLKPSAVGFTVNTDQMIAAADQQRTNTPFWSSFWDYLFNKVPSVSDTPLKSTIDEKRLRLYLMTEIASRYDKVPEASMPIPGSVNFQLGKPGEVLDIDQSIPLIENALKSSSQRSVNLVINNSKAPRPSMENLQVLVKQILDQSKFDG